MIPKAHTISSSPETRKAARAACVLLWITARLRGQLGRRPLFCRHHFLTGFRAGPKNHFGPCFPEGIINEQYATENGV